MPTQLCFPFWEASSVQKKKKRIPRKPRKPKEKQKVSKIIQLEFPWDSPAPLPWEREVPSKNNELLAVGIQGWLRLLKGKIYQLLREIDEGLVNTMEDVEQQLTLILLRRMKYFSARNEQEAVALVRGYVGSRWKLLVKEALREMGYLQRTRTERGQIYTFLPAVSLEGTYAI